MNILFQILIASFLTLSVSLAGTAEKIKIASIFEKSGPGSVGNEAAIEGIRYAVKELNSQGGLLGKQIELLELDNRSSAIHSKLMAQRAVKAGAIAVFGANWSSNSLAMANVLQAAKILMISPFSTNPAVTLVGDYIFRVCYIDPFQGLAIAKFIFHDLNAQTAATLINANRRYSEGLAGYFKHSFEKLGGKVLLEVNYLQDADDFSLYLKKIKLLEPDIVFLPGSTTDSAKIVRQAREQGLDVTFMGGDAWGNTMYSHAGPALNGNYYAEHWHNQYQNIESRQFVKKYHEQFGIIVNDVAPALTHDVVFLFADAVRRAGTLDPVKIKNALAATKNFKGVTGSISFNENGDPIKPVVIVKFDKGTSIYVKTIEP